MLVGAVAALALVLFAPYAGAYHDAYDLGIVLSDPNVPLPEDEITIHKSGDPFEHNRGHGLEPESFPGGPRLLYPGGPPEPDSCDGFSHGSTGWYYVYFPQPSSVLVTVRKAGVVNNTFWDLESNANPDVPPGPGDGFDGTLTVFAVTPAGEFFDTSLDELDCADFFGFFDASEETLVFDAGYQGARWYAIQVGGADDEQDYHELKISVLYDNDADKIPNYRDRCPSEFGDIGGDGPEAGCPSDRDQDGHGRLPFGRDCNDGNAGINPGVRDIPHNNVDENCDGRDNKDGDGDGHDAQGFGNDCADNNGGINPAAAEVGGNKADENCDGRADSAPLDPFPVVTAPNSGSRKGARFGKLRVAGVARGYLIRVTCRGRGRGCVRSQRKVATSTKPVTFRLPRFLRAGGVVQVWITLPGENRIGKYTEYKARRGKRAKRTDGCIYPDAPTRPRKCS